MEIKMLRATKTGQTDSANLRGAAYYIMQELQDTPVRTSDVITNIRRKHHQYKYVDVGVFVVAIHNLIKHGYAEYR